VLKLSADIAPRPVAEALAAFAHQTGLQLIYVSTIAETLQSKGAPAGLSAPAALTQLLDGTGLAFEFLNARTVRILPAPTVVAAASAAASAPQRASRRPPAGDASGLEEVIVNRQEARGGAEQGSNQHGRLVTGGPAGTGCKGHG
jgi:hypothetical protein